MGGEKVKLFSLNWTDMEEIEEEESDFELGRQVGIIVKGKDTKKSKIRVIDIDDSKAARKKF